MPIVCKEKMLNYRLFAGQKVFANAEKVLPILPEAFNEAFLLRQIWRLCKKYIHF